MGSMVSRAEALVIDLSDAGGASLGVSITQVRPAARDFRLFFQDEYARLARALFVLTANRTEAEELTQEAMVRVYEHWDRVGLMDSPAGYLYRTALNLHRSKLRRIATRARSRAPRMCNKVLLPEPDSPTIASNSPLAT